MSDGFKYNRLSKDDAVVLLIDDQAGLISLVQDYSPGEFKNNVGVSSAVCGMSVTSAPSTLPLTSRR